jgi:hypothetical protein
MEFSVRDYPIGRINGAAVGYKNTAEFVISARITHREGWFQTVDHAFMTGHDELTISGGIWNRQKTDFITCGQIIDELDNIVSYAPEWSRERVDVLRDMWQNYHLNGMNAGCIHQDGPGDPCPRGYKYGSSWLVQPLNPAIKDIVWYFFSDLDRGITSA